jgi:1,2-diacylglycerol 3-alpha-glucosyltransferase
MQPVTTMPASVASGFEAVFCDIDDTLTNQGKLPASAYQALWRLSEHGLAVVPVTGRPAGWCDLIVREWPVAGVIGENGAFALWEEDGHLKRMCHPDIAGPEVRARLDAVRRDVLAEVPGSRVAQDQPYRLYDLAIDFREEPPDLGFEAAERIRQIFVRHGAHAKVSSIHVNGWFGNYDKLAMVRLFVRQRFGVELDERRERYTFCGDSPNDEPMFGYFPHACAVANVARFAATMHALPRYVASREGGHGFAEIVEVLLAARATA